MSNDYQDVYDLGGYRRRRQVGTSKVNIACELIDEGRQMSIDEFISEIKNLADEKIHILQSIIQECTNEMLSAQLPYHGNTISVADLLGMMLFLINEKMERIAYEKELDKFLNKRK